MRINRRGITLIELVVAIGLSTIVLGVGYRIYADVSRVQDFESRRESAMLSVQNAMARIKEDVRAAASVSGSRDVLMLSGEGGRVTYRTVRSGLERGSKWGHTVFRAVDAEFTVGTGVGVVVRSNTMAHGRPIRIEVSSYVSPRNR